MDLRLALRSLRRRPTVFAAVVIAVALALAVTAALFSVLDGLLFRPLPFHDPDRLVTVDFRPVGGSLPELAYLPELAARRKSLREAVIGSPLVAAAAQADFAVFFDSYETKVLGLEVQGVDSQFFPLLGLSPILGATFSLEHERSPAARSRESLEPLPIIIGYDLWRRLFGADPGIVGVRELAGRSVRIVGVMGPDVKFPGETDVWAAEWSTRGWPPTYIRLAPGATVTQLAGFFPDLRFKTLREVMHPGEAGALPLLFGAAIVLLIVTWVQVTALMFSRALEQLRDIGIRRALGAGRVHLVRQFAAQSALTAGTAFVLAWLILRPLTAFIISMLPAEVSRGHHLSPDLRTFLFGCAMSLLGFGLLTIIPGGVARRATPLELLNGRFIERYVRVERVRQALLVAQMTLTTLLLYLSGLALHSFVQAVTFNYGFDSEHVLAFTPPRTTANRTRQQRSAYREEFSRKQQVSVERLQSVSGVIGAAAFFSGPLGIANQRGAIPIRPLDGLPVYEAGQAHGNAVGVDFVRALGATMIAGHSFDGPGYAGRDDIIVVNQTLARRLSPPVSVMGQELRPAVIGRRFETVDGKGEVIGVIKDFVDTKLDVPSVPQFFMPDRRSLAAATVFIRVSSPAEIALPTVRGVLEGIWGPLPPRHFSLMRDELRPVLVPYRGQSILLGLIVACCLPIAAIGLTGALTYSVRVRTREIAIRMAMGADPSALRRSVTRRALGTVGLGILFGVALGVATGRVIAHQLFQVRPLDVSTMMGVTITLVVLGWLASVVPARQASRVDPVEALRQV